MQSFARAVRLALRNRLTLAAVIVSSAMVGILWGANIGVVYPFVQVLFQDEEEPSLQQWIDGEIAAARQTSRELRQEIAALQAERAALPQGDRSEIDRRIGAKTGRLQAEGTALERSLRLQPYIHRFLPRDPFQTLVLIVLALLAGTVLKNVFIMANTILVERLAQLAVFDLRKQFYRQTLRLGLASFGDQRNSELLSHFTYDMNLLRGGLNHLFGKALREPLKMTVCLVGASMISWRLLLLSLLVSPPALLLMRLLAGSIKRANRRAMEEMSQLYNALTETFSGIQTVKAFTMEKFERQRFHQSAKDFFRKAMRIVFYNSLTKPVTELLGIGVISLALVAGAYLVLKQETHLLGIQMCDRPLSPASLLLFYGLLAGVSDPARKLSDVLASLQGAVAAAERIYQMMDREPTILESANPRTCPRPHRRLLLDHVSFHYQPDQPILRDVHCEISYGETIAIVGPNGCGKSTLINLLPRFYDPTEGSIRLDDVDLREMRLRDLRRRIGVVTQQTHLFDDTVMNNIRYGSPQASDEDVRSAARQAHAHRFIEEQLGDGYRTLVGQGGSRLSGGQRQRIALARAILRDPDILILDEATSQIDLESEQLIHDALQEFTRGRTTIMITHRLSTLTLADRIVVMEAGQLVDFATHEELIQRCGLYRRLHDIQLRQSA